MIYFKILEKKKKRDLKEKIRVNKTTRKTQTKF
jgi:hypothetical protein